MQWKKVREIKKKMCRDEMKKIDPFRYRRVQMRERCMQMSEMINFFLTDFTLLCIYLTGIV